MSGVSCFLREDSFLEGRLVLLQALNALLRLCIGYIGKKSVQNVCIHLCTNLDGDLQKLRMRVFERLELVNISLK